MTYFFFIESLVHFPPSDEAQKTLEESLTNEEMGFAFEMRQSKRNGTVGRNTTLSRRSVAGSVGVLGAGGGGGTLTSHGTAAGPTVVGKPPPRPTPASVAYHSDDESARGYDENPDDSSLTEKPSEISSTDSQVFSFLKKIYIFYMILISSIISLTNNIIKSYVNFVNK